MIRTKMDAVNELVRVRKELELANQHLARIAKAWEENGSRLCELDEVRGGLVGEAIDNFDYFDGES